MQVVDGGLGVRRCLEDRACIGAEHAEAVIQIRGVILARDEGDPEGRAEKRAPQFGHEFLPRVAVIAEAHAAEVAVETRGVLRPVCELVGLGRPVRDSASKNESGGGNTIASVDGE
jgi:hypothetical protein